MKKNFIRQNPIRYRATAIIIQNDRVLLFHRIKPGHDYFIFPGGGVDQGETIEDALKREVNEELTLTVKKFRKLFVIKNLNVPAWATIHPDQRQEHHYFLVEDFAGSPELGGPEKAQMNEQNEYHIAWLSFDELRKIDSIFPKEGVSKLLDVLETDK